MSIERLRLLLAIPIAIFMAQCSGKNCASVGVCVYTIHFDFVPAVAARESIRFTVAGGDASYTASYSPGEQTATSLELHVTEANDGGGFVATSADLSFEMPKLVTYSVIADGRTVATGTAEPQYQHYTRGSEDCKQSCTTANLTVPVSL